MRIKYFFAITILFYCVAIVYCAEKEATPATSSSTNANSATSGTRQAGGTALTTSILNTLTSFFKSSSITSFLPGLLLFGIGAMLFPAFGVLLREGRRSDYNVQPSNLAFSNPLFAKNLPPIVYSKEFEAISRGMPYKTPQSQYAQARSMQSSSFDLNNILLEALGKIQKSLDTINTDSNKKMATNTIHRMPSN